jgi:ArsR family transcriptional regulator, virulence genes transcriptional regulator
LNPEILERAKAQAEICRVFNNPARVLIFWALAEGELSVSEIAATVEISLQNTSQHLRLMKDRDVLTCRREGQTIYYRVSDLSLFERLGFVLTNPSP